MKKKSGNNKPKHKQRLFLGGEWTLFYVCFCVFCVPYSTCKMGIKRGMCVVFAMKALQKMSKQFA